MTTPLQPADIVRIAQLAQLAITDQEQTLYAHELTTIFDLVEQMNVIDTDQVVPLAHPLELTQRLRPDHVTETDQRDLLQSNAPSTKDGFYLVPRVIS
jgi:aspartyl-tRNA(Asn)/glutamyl-tRNA(Gln) amidotransferase subunit C